MRDWVKPALAEGTVNSADTAFGDLICTLATVPDDALWSASVLASAAVQNGDVCVTLNQVVTISGTHNAAKLRDMLLTSGAVQGAQLPVTQPLVLDSSDRLYLSRYWKAEWELADALLACLEESSVEHDNAPAIELLDQLFPLQSDFIGPDWQRVAAVVSARQRLAVITGGPGTGKTRTVARLLAVLQSPLTDEPRIALLAPTGKAAARLLESLRGEAAQLRQQGLSLALPETASTLHRALGYQPGQAGFKHNADYPLPFDLVLVDEASMVDLSLMHSLVLALCADCRLILLGDRDQLASVEAGNVLGDIVGDAAPGRYSSKQRDALIRTCPGFDTIAAEEHQGGIADTIVELQHSYRFDAGSGIGRFAQAVNSDNADEAIVIGNDDAFQDFRFVNPERTPLNNQLLLQAVPAAVDVIGAKTVEAALTASLGFRILCALYQGPRGVEYINRFIESRLIRLGHMQPNQLWYRGRPVLITRNDPGTELYNGDTGLIWPNASGDMMAWFADGESAVRAVSPGRLPAHQTCFAMTVHKTQGSEFTNVLLVLPEPPHTLLSRDLLYTGITRARRTAVVYTSENAVRVAVSTRRVRASGLRDRLKERLEYRASGGGADVE